MLDTSHLLGYWQGLPLQANILIALNLLGALLLGMLVGYERTYHGRAAGIRTYGLVCMASCALTVLVGYAPFWFGGAGSPVSPDPTRVIQGIVSGIGFLCGGVIMKDGLSINGLTTAASLWAASAIGVLVGVGLYGASVTLAGLSMLSMTLGRIIQERLPIKEGLGITLRFRKGEAPDDQQVLRFAQQHGCLMHLDRIAINYEDGATIWRFTLEAAKAGQKIGRTQVARDLAALHAVHSFSLENARH